MKAHAALPHRKNLQRMREVVARLVKQAIAQPPADHHAHDSQKQDVFNILARPGARAGDGRVGLVPQSPGGQKKEKSKRRQVGQAVPVNGQWTKLKSDWIDVRINEHGSILLEIRKAPGR